MDQRSVLAKKIIDLTPQFKRHILDNYSEFPLGASEKLWLEEMSKILLFEELKLGVADDNYEELVSKLKPYSDKLGYGSAFLTRIALHVINSIFKPEKETLEEKIKKLEVEVKNKSEILDSLGSANFIKKTPEDFIKDYFDSNKRKEITEANRKYYFGFYSYQYYTLLVKFLQFINKNL